MARHMANKQREKDEADARAAIEAGDWVVYMSPRMVINVQRSLIPVVARAHNLDAMDAQAAIVHIIEPAVTAMKRSMDFGQGECHVPPPIGGAWHILTMDGQWWVSDREFFTYHS
jgi:hypothetical protein